MHTYTTAAISELAFIHQRAFNALWKGLFVEIAVSKNSKQGKSWSKIKENLQETNLLKHKIIFLHDFGTFGNSLMVLFTLPTPQV